MSGPRHHSPAAISRGNQMLAPERPRMRLLEWKQIGKGFLVGCAKVILPNGLEIADIGIFSKDGRTWSQLPAQQMRDADGRPITDDRGKARYISSIKWSTRELQDGFSEALIALVLAEHPGAIPGGGP
jgi:hypothetical protein